MCVGRWVCVLVSKYADVKITCITYAYVRGVCYSESIRAHANVRATVHV